MERLGITDDKLEGLRASKADEMLQGVKDSIAQGENINAKVLHC